MSIHGNYHSVRTSFHTFITPVPMLWQGHNNQLSLGILTVFTYFASSTWSNGTHRATSEVIFFLASESLDASERCRDLPLRTVFVFSLVGETDSCRSFGGSSPPPVNSTHWTRYVFLICEKTWMTSPAGLTCTIRTPSCALSSSLSSSLSSLMRFCRFESEYRCDGGSTSKSLRMLSGISDMLAAVADAPEILGAVGNSCSPARSPREGYQSIFRCSVFTRARVRGIKHRPPSGRRTSKKNRLRSSFVRHSTALTESSSSRAFFRSTFMG